MDFIASYNFTGLEKYADGVLGLAMPKQNSSHNLILQLYNSGIISSAQISFIFSKDSNYAVLGGYEKDKIYGELIRFKNHNNTLNFWAIET